jgi:hypothetical protein
MEVSGEGFMGTIPEGKIQAALEPKMEAFQRCFFDGAADEELVGGRFEFYFRVGLDGGVEWVDPRESSVGHRGTGRCLLGVAARTRFPKPKGGGPAEFAWGFEIDPVGGGRPAVDWSEGRVADVVAQQRGSLARCELGGDPVVVTAYVVPGGEVRSVGVAGSTHGDSARLDCVADVVRAWRMPDPGSYPAKVSFEVR